MKYKACRGFKADVGDGSATFAAIVSVFDNPDHAGDVVRAGAFLATLKEWEASGDPIPVLWSHNMADPLYNIGSVREAAELAAGDSRIPDWCDPWVKEHGGLWVAGDLDTGGDASPVAVAARKLLKQRRVTQWSYAYDVIDGGWATADGMDVYELRTLKLYEVSPTQVGANDLTQLLSAKASALVANLPEDPAKIQTLIASMSEHDVRTVLAMLAKSLSDRHDGGTADSGPVKGEEPETVKPEEPTTIDAESIRLLSDALLID